MTVVYGCEWQGGLVFKPNKTKREIPHKPLMSPEEDKEAFAIVLRTVFHYTNEQIKRFWDKEERA